jgi:MoaA/NifB/PqqE/SkfB family radical SAM enzyme
MQRNLRTPERRSLAEAIPLPMPLMIRVDPSNACNFRCQYCPTAFPDLLKEVGRPKGIMAFPLFEKIMGDIGALPSPLNKLYLYKDGEPLVNKRLPDMIALAKGSGRVGEVWTTSNGALLNPELNQRLVDAGLDLIKISVQGLSAADYLDVAGVKIDYEKFRENVADLHSRRGGLHVHVKIVDTGLSPEARAKFVADFEAISDSVHIDPLMGWSLSSVRDFRLGQRSALGPDGLPLTRREVCAFPFYTLSVNFDGTVSVCCVDWAHQTVVGDVTRESLLDIWRGPALAAIRLMHLEGRRHENRACGDCQYLETLADDIDDAAPQIIERLRAPAGDRAAE